ncbi:MAG: translocation/assembly module TamB domain-containing protein, partial [Cyanobacteria bacterium J06639_1]
LVWGATDRDRRIDFDIRTALDDAPVALVGAYQIPDRLIRLAVDGTDLPAGLLPSIVPNLPLEVTAGEADVELRLSWQPQQPLEMDGTVVAEGAAIALSTAPVELNDLASTIYLKDRLVRFENASGAFREIPFAAAGTINWSGEAIAPDAPADDLPADEADAIVPAGFQLDAQVERETVSDLLERFDITLPFSVASEATVDVAIAGPLTQPQVTGNLQGLTPLVVDEVATLSAYSGTFAIEGTTVAIDNVRGSLAAGSAGTVSGTGAVNLQETAASQAQFQLDIAGADANALVAAYGGDLPKSGGTLAADVTVEIARGVPLIAANWQLSGGDIAGRGQLGYRRGEINISNAQLALGGGTATGSAVSPAPGRGGDRQFRADILARDIDTSFFVPNNSGSISADLTASGSTADFGLDALRAEGRVDLPAGIAEVPGPIAAQIVWDGRAVSISDGTILDRARINGRIPFDVKRQTIGALDLGVTVDRLPLSDIPQLPADIPVAGTISLNGRVTGTPNDLQLDSQLDLDRFDAAGFQFASLQGPLRWQPDADGVTVDLRDPNATETVGDRIAVQLDTTYTPLSFEVRQEQIEAIGQRLADNPDEFQVQLLNVPLELASAIVPGEMSGILNGDLRVNLANRSASGSARADELSWEGLELEQFQTDFGFADGRFTVDGGEILLANSLYQFDGTLVLPGDIPLSLDLRIKTENAALQDLFQTLQLRQWSDLSRPPLSPLPTTAADLDVRPLSVLPRSLYERLEAYSSVLAIQRTRKGSKRRAQIPELDTFQGDFDAEVQISGALDNLAAGFSLDGRNWTLDPYQLDTVSLRGALKNGELSLASLEATQGDRSGSFVGTLGLQRQEGQLAIDKFPIEILSRLLPNVPDFSGDLDASAVIGGNLRDPQARGTVQLVDAFLNGEPLEEVSGEFDYGRGRLEVDGTLLATGDEPLSIQGNIPYRFPFATVAAPSDRLDLTVNVQNEGLKLLDIFTDVARWESGTGLLDIAIGGTLQEPTVRGNFRVADGVVSAPVLPEPIQQLAGTVTFDLDRLNVESLTGSFSEGQLVATGQLPINPRGASDDAFPLTVTLDDLSLTLPDKLYSGAVNGEAIVTGTALQPQLGGRIELSNGSIDVGARSGNAAQTGDSPLVLQDLSLVLGKSISVKQGLLFSFAAVGDLDIGGSLSDLQPEGTIRLDRGRLNLGVASFRLDRSRPNTAVFSPEWGLDPLLDVRVFTQATEVSATPNSPTVFDTNPSQFGGQQNIRIQATVRGRASELNTSTTTSRIVELSSSPARTEEEIVALLGANALGSVGDATLTGFALSALQFSIQDSLGDFFGLDELRINSFANPDGSDFGLGLEAAKDITRDLSLSVQRTLSDPDEDTRYNVRYRINDSLLLRTGSDFQENSQGSIEFETRF